MAINSCVEQKEEKVLVVVKANTIVNPRAMMIHLENAHSADPAMVATIWFILVAPLAMTTVSCALLFQRIEVLWGYVFGTVIDPFWGIWDTSRMNVHTPNVTEDKKQGDTMEYYPLPPATGLCFTVSHLGSQIKLKQPEQVAEQIAKVQGEYDAANEGHRKPFRWLIES